MDKKQSVVKVQPDLAQAGSALLEAANKIAEAYGFQGLLTAKERRRSVSSWFSQEFVTAVGARYDAQKALIGGDFDTAAMREDLTFVASYEAAATAARTLARAIDDQILQRKEGVSLEANAIYVAM